MDEEESEDSMFYPADCHKAKSTHALIDDFIREYARESKILGPRLTYRPTGCEEQAHRTTLANSSKKITRPIFPRHESLQYRVERPKVARVHGLHSLLKKCSINSQKHSPAPTKASPPPDAKHLVGMNKSPEPNIFLPLKVGSPWSGDVQLEEDAPEIIEEDKNNELIYERESRDTIVYIQIKNNFNHIRVLSRPGVIIILLALRRMPILNRSMIEAIEQSHGIETLINLLGAHGLACHLATLKLLVHYASANSLVRIMLRFGIVEVLMKRLDSNVWDIKCLIGALLSRLGQFGIGRQEIIRKKKVLGFISLCLTLLSHAKLSKGTALKVHKYSNERRDHGVMIACLIMALSSYARSKFGRLILRRAGFMPLLAETLRTKIPMVVLYTMEALDLCSEELYYNVSTRGEKLVPLILKYIDVSDVCSYLSVLACRVLAQCAEKDETSSHQIRLHGGIHSFRQILSDSQGTKKDVRAVFLVLWKCCFVAENIAVLHSLHTVPLLLHYLRENITLISRFHPCKRVILLHKFKTMETQLEMSLYLTGILAQMCSLNEARKSFLKEGGLDVYTQMVPFSNSPIIVNIVIALGLFTQQEVKENQNYLKNDPTQVLFSLLKADEPQVKMYAATALTKYFENSPEARKSLLEYVGASEIIFALLRTSTEDVLAALCQLIAQMAFNYEMLCVLMDMGVMRHLVRFLHSQYPPLLVACIHAIHITTRHPAIMSFYKEEKVVPHLCRLLRQTSDHQVKREIVKALGSLSIDPNNAEFMKMQRIDQLLLPILTNMKEEGAHSSAIQAVKHMRQLTYACDPNHFRRPRQFAKTIRVNAN